MAHEIVVENAVGLEIKVRPADAEGSQLESSNFVPFFCGLGLFWDRGVTRAAGRLPDQVALISRIALVIGTEGHPELGRPLFLHPIKELGIFLYEATAYTCFPKSVISKGCAISPVL